ncbi:MAG: RtcB family protein [Mangrovibacterium sp.]
MAQARNLANLPFIFKHVALMPDCHSGYGMPIGGVIPTKGVIIPNAVGVDIGCGMCAVKTSLNEIHTDVLKKIMSGIRELVLEEEIEKLNSKGIVHSIRNTSDLDEAPGAYKNIDVVMQNQADLVEILVKSSPLAVIKGCYQ